MDREKAAVLGISPLWGFHMHSDDHLNRQRIHRGQAHHHIHLDHGDSSHESDEDHESPHTKKIPKFFLEELIENKTCLDTSFKKIADVKYQPISVKAMQTYLFDSFFDLILRISSDSKELLNQRIFYFITSRAPPGIS